ncbi:exocyst complex component 3-like [Rhinoraja longicauda]
MSNTVMVLNDNLPGAMDSPVRGQAACDIPDIQDGPNIVRHSSKKTSPETSSPQVRVPDASPKEQFGILRNIYRLSKRKLSFSPSKTSDKDKPSVMSNESPTNNSQKGIREEEVMCVAVKDQDDKATENTMAPLSVMEINQLITSKLFLEANENINKLEKELLNERKLAKDEECHQKDMVKVRDLHLLCDALAEQITSIIANSLTTPEENSSHLRSAINVIEIEEAADKEWHETMNHSDAESFRRPRKWKELWAETVSKSVKERVANLPFIAKEQKASWMALHLLDLQQTIVEDLKTVKHFTQKCYPESYKIFNVYLKCYYQTVSSHLECIQQKQLESHDLYALLNWIIHTYKSGDVMSHADLLPEVNVEELGPLLDQGIVKNIMDKYTEALKLKVPTWMRNTLKEDKSKWSESAAYEPEIMMGCYHSHVASDICEMIASHLKESGKISKDLKERVLCYCLEELTILIHCYQQDLKVRKQSASNPLPLLIVSINSYIDLEEFLKTLKQDNAAHLEKVEKALKNSVQELNKILSDDLLFQALPCFKKLMRSKWLTCSEDFDQLIRKTEMYCKDFRKMKQANCQVLISDLHYQFVKEYIKQIMKMNLSWKLPARRVAAANKIKEELGAISKMYQEFGTTASWLFPVTQHLFEFIDANDSDLESKLIALYKDYPDIGEDHISALLYFRGISRGRKKSKLMKYFNQLEETVKEPIKATHPCLFADIDTGPVTCLLSF